MQLSDLPNLTEAQLQWIENVRRALHDFLYSHTSLSCFVKDLTDEEFARYIVFNHTMFPLEGGSWLEPWKSLFEADHNLWSLICAVAESIDFIAIDDNYSLSEWLGPLSSELRVARLREIYDLTDVDIRMDVALYIREPLADRHYFRR